MAIEHINTRDQILEIYKRFEITEEEVNKTITEIKNWLLHQHHLPQNLDDGFIRLFAIGANKGIDDCTKRLDSLYYVRSFLPKYFTTKDALNKDFITSSNSSGIGIMPGTTKDNCKVVALKLLDQDPAKYLVEAGMSRLIAMLDVLMKMDVCGGLYALIDLCDFTFSHHIKLRPAVVRDLLFYIQNIYPIKVRLIVIVNVPMYFKLFYETFMRPLLKKKLVERVHLFSDCPKELFNLIPKNLVPSDLGGEGLTMKECNDLWYEKLVEERDWLMNVACQKSNESKREGKPPINMPTCSVM